jgi:hypothetical protein
MFTGRNRAGDRESAFEKFDRALEIFERIKAKKDIEKVLNKKSCWKNSVLSGEKDWIKLSKPKRLNEMV